MQDFKHLPGQDKTPGGLVADYFQKVGAAGYEALYHQASFDELKRYLRKLQNHQSGPEDAEIVLLETTYLLAEHVSCKVAVNITKQSLHSENVIAGACVKIDPLVCCT